MSSIYAQKYPRRDFYYSYLPASSRLLISCFYLAMAAAIALSVVMFHAKTSFQPSVAAEYVRGNENVERPASPKMLFPKTKEELGDVSHPHLFIQGILLFILAHLFTLTRLKDRSKSIVIVSAFASYLLGIAAPWLVRFVHPGLSYVQIGNMIVLTFALGYMMAVPFREMWWPKEPARQSQNGESGVVKLAQHSL
ncbi:MAG TPA: hypothetical protein VI895_13445 [Bdellovibrionota bacterium]|nr:hypothetical protein [Bdellovibrionota bacterium]